jgi:hypothetical protein
LGTEIDWHARCALSAVKVDVSSVLRRAWNTLPHWTSLIGVVLAE